MQVRKPEPRSMGVEPLRQVSQFPLFSAVYILQLAILVVIGGHGSDAPTTEHVTHEVASVHVVHLGRHASSGVVPKYPSINVKPVGGSAVAVAREQVAVNCGQGRHAAVVTPSSTGW